ncbi:MAG: hypothetical protein ACI8ZM_005616, partial [Crocinitomix sp.]
MIPTIPILRHKGINILLSAFANMVCFIFLKKPR